MFKFKKLINEFDQEIFSFYENYPTNGDFYLFDISIKLDFLKFNDYHLLYLEDLIYKNDINEFKNQLLKLPNKNVNIFYTPLFNNILKQFILNFYNKALLISFTL